MRGLDASPVSLSKEYVELHRPFDQTADAEDTHDIERRQNRRDAFDFAAPAIPHLVPRALDDAKVQIDIRIRVAGTVSKAPFEPSRRIARISRENLDRALDQLATPHRKRNVIAHRGTVPKLKVNADAETVW